jgi:hypothetical protein
MWIFVCRRNTKISYLVSTTLVTPHKINNFADNTFSPPQHIWFVLLPLNKLKFCVTLKKPSQKPQIHVKPTTYIRKQCTGITRTVREYDWWQFGNSGSVALPTVAEIANSRLKFFDQNVTLFNEENYVFILFDKKVQKIET